MGAIHACAALAAFGNVAGLPPLARELCYHVQPASTALALAGLALCAAAILGLWYPRRLIQRRLAHTRSSPMTDPALQTPGVADNSELRFAGRLAAAIHASLAAAWLLASVVVNGLETWRGLLASHFYLPPSLFVAFVTAPALLGLAMISVCATVALVTVHGWYRLATQPRTNVARLWRSLLAATLAGSLAAWLVGETRDLPLLVVGGGLAAAAVALGGSTRAARASSAGGPSIQPRGRKPDSSVRRSLLSAALAGSVIALPAFWTIVGEHAVAPQVAPSVCVVGLGAVFGAGLGRVLLRAGLAADVAPFLVIVALALAVMPVGGANRTLPGLALVSTAATACVILVGRRISLASGSVQYSLAWTGGALACGAGVSFLASLAMPDLARRDVAPYWSLVVALLAGLILLLDPQTRAWLRGSNAALAGVAAAIVLMLTWPAPQKTPAREADGAWARRPAVAVGRQWLRTGVLRWRTVDGEAGARAASADTLWDVDHVGPRVDVLFVPAVQWQRSWPPAVSHDTGIRLLRRAARTLVPGGRLVIELDAGGATAALALTSPEQIDPSWSAHRLLLNTPAGAYEAVILGANVSEWLAQRARPEGCTATLATMTPSPAGM